MVLKLNEIYHEDCLETLKKINDKSIDIVITSPPYNMNLRIHRGMYRSRQIVKEFSSKYNNFPDNLPIDEYNAFHSKVLKELLRVSHLIFYNVQIVTGSKRSIFKMIGDFSEYLKDIIIWDKGYGAPAMGENVLNRRSELILIFETDYPISRQFRKSGRFERGTLDDLWEIKKPHPNERFSEHGAVFPVKLVERILANFSRPGDVVYERFMGTGTTVIVAKNMDRNYIGSETNSEYITVAKDRLTGKHPYQKPLFVSIK